MRDEAERILEDARKALDEAGQQAVVALGGLEGSKTESEGDWFGASGDVHGPKFNWDFFERTFGLEEKGEKGSPFKLSLGSAEGEAHVGKWEGKWEDYYGDFKVNADGSVTLLGAEGSAEATVNGEGVKINAGGTLSIVKAEGELKGSTAPRRAACRARPCSARPVRATSRSARPACTRAASCSPAARSRARPAATSAASGARSPPRAGPALASAATRTSASRTAR